MVDRSCRRSRGFLGQLLALDDHLDVLLLISAVLIVTPPHWSFVLAAKSKVFASGTGRGSFVALLSS